MEEIEPVPLTEEDWEWLAKMAQLGGSKVAPPTAISARLWSHGYATPRPNDQVSITSKGYKALRDRAGGD